ncbi:MAG: FtsW/RodA/SpoVE family cell cycle protein [Chloroflexi bacterium]|nr:FtsW/RodA/SpoVE family cell cycle protein [Chloroflexota bacterium]
MTLRWRELSLLFWPMALFALGAATLALIRRGDLAQRDFLLAVAFVGLLLALHAWLTWRHRGADQVLLPVAAMLVAVGLTIVARLQPAVATRHFIWLVIGLIAMVVAAEFVRQPSRLRRYKYTWATIGLAITMTTLVFGIDPNGSGARLWLGAAGFYFQPSEIMKVLLVIFFAAYLEEKHELLASAVYRLGPLRLPPLPYLAPLLLMWGITIALLAIQRDMGAALLFYGVFLSLLYVASSRLLYLWGGLIAFVLPAYAGYLWLPYIQGRVETWLNPWADPEGRSYQILQALAALGSGGVAGTGLGFGQPTLIPAAHTDFPLAAIGEELGLVGTLALVMLYLVLIFRGYQIAVWARDGFQQLLATGLTTVLALQALIIMSGSLKLIPLTGITLPFVSYGGSSLLANCIIVGLLLAVSERRTT